MTLGGTKYLARSIKKRDQCLVYRYGVANPDPCLEEKTEQLCLQRTAVPPDFQHVQTVSSQESVVFTMMYSSSY